MGRGARMRDLQAKDGSRCSAFGQQAGGRCVGWRNVARLGALVGGQPTRGLGLQVGGQ